jgi:hypothetical protein
MDEQIRYRGKTYSPKEINEIREVLAAHPEKSRRFLSQEICRRWGWTQPNGILKDMVCRGLLLQLEAQGLIELPPPRNKPSYLLSEPKKPALVQVDQTPIIAKLSDVKPIEVLQVR